MAKKPEVGAAKISSDTVSLVLVLADVVLVADPSEVVEFFVNIR